jgi:hypothetical protein
MRKDNRMIFCGRLPYLYCRINSGDTLICFQCSNRFFEGENRYNVIGLFCLLPDYLILSTIC